MDILALDVTTKTSTAHILVSLDFKIIKEIFDVFSFSIKINSRSTACYVGDG